ncbi:FBP domain-containing protein [Agrococcus casei]|uniref:FBP domain-containing protein n=1 Tax=Agrococcus casei TaxID=343512 RepID=UPI003F928D8A
MRPVTEEQLRSSFINATDDELRRLPMPGLRESIWEEREYLGWRDMQAAQLGYVSLWQGSELVSIVVRTSGSLRSGIAAMCSMCHSTQPATQVRLFTARFAGKKGLAGSSVGTYICESLSCPMVIRRAAPHMTTPSQLERRGGAMLERITRFVAKVADES